MHRISISVAAAMVASGLLAACPAPQLAADAGDLTDAGGGTDDGGVTNDGGVADAGPPPFPCVPNWPGPADASVSPSLPVDAGVIKWTRTFNWTALSGSPAATGDRIAIPGSNRLFILDGSGNLVAEVPEPGAFSGTWVKADHSGHFLFATSHVTSIDRDGGFAFSAGFGAGPDPDHETPIAGEAALAPDGMLYFASSTGVLHALDTVTGQMAWTRPVDEKTNSALPVWVGPGVGDVVFVGGVAHDRHTGAILGALRDEDGGVTGPGILTARGLTAGTLREVNGSYAWTSYLFDPCGGLLERVGTSSTTDVFALSGFDEHLLLEEVTLAAPRVETWRWFPGADAGVVVPASTPMVIGADGVTYAIGCNGGPTQSMAVRAFDGAFAPLWNVDLPGECSWFAPVLLDDGTLVVARKNVTVEVVGIQTTSPGVAHTTWPAHEHDMGRTDWLSVP